MREHHCETEVHNVCKEMMCLKWPGPWWKQTGGQQNPDDIVPKAYVSQTGPLCNWNSSESYGYMDGLFGHAGFVIAKLMLGNPGLL